jgi:hypothetical protein
MHTIIYHARRTCVLCDLAPLLQRHGLLCMEAASIQQPLLHRRRGVQQCWRVLSSAGEPLGEGAVYTAGNKRPHDCITSPAALRVCGFVPPHWVAHVLVGIVCRWECECCCTVFFGWASCSASPMQPDVSAYSWLLSSGHRHERPNHDRSDPGLSWQVAFPLHGELRQAFKSACEDNQHAARKAEHHNTLIMCKIICYDNFSLCPGKLACRQSNLGTSAHQ